MLHVSDSRFERPEESFLILMWRRLKLKVCSMILHFFKQLHMLENELFFAVYFHVILRISNALTACFLFAPVYSNLGRLK